MTDADFFGWALAGDALFLLWLLLRSVGQEKRLAAQEDRIRALEGRKP